MSSSEQDAIFARLKHSLQLLACSAELQLGMLPDFVCKADELALDFDHWSDVVLGRYLTVLKPDQVSTLTRLRRQFDEISGWSDDNVRQASEWQKVRQLARQALESFGWPLEIPQTHNEEFVPAAPGARSAESKQ